MKILILDDLFSIYFFKLKTSVRLYYLFENFKIFKIQQLIKKLRKKYGNDIEIKIITNAFRKFSLNESVNVQLLSEYRINIERNDFQIIKEKVIKKTRENLIELLTILKKSKIFTYNNFFYGDIVEFNFAEFFKNVFSMHEIIKKIILENKFDKLILFKSNPKFIEFYKSLLYYNKTIEYHQDFFLNLSYNLKFFYFFKFLFDLLLLYLKEHFIFRSLLKKNKISEKNVKILFIYSSKNQFDSINPFFKLIKKKKTFMPIYYMDKSYLTLIKVPKILKFYFVIKKNWMKYRKIISSALKFENLKFDEILEDFFQNELIFRLIRLSLNHYHIKKLFNKLKPSLVILSDEIRPESRFYSNYCKLRNIPTLYITHGSIPIWPELVSISNFSIIATPGESSKQYLLEKGEDSRKIIITGRPKYEKFYKGKIKKLEEIRDPCTNTLYNFNSKKFTILFATSPVDFISKEIILRNVVQAIKDLNLIDNFIIKLHPREDDQWYRKILKKMNVDPIVVKDYDIFELMVSSDVYLSKSSATILEAMIVGIPIILLDFVNLNFLYTATYQFCEEKYLIRVKNKYELVAAIKKLLYCSDFRMQYSNGLKKLALKHSYYEEKKSANEIIYDFIKTLLKDKI